MTSAQAAPTAFFAALPVDPTLRAALAPQGALRVCINLGNALLAQPQPTARQTAGVRGVSVDLALALADWLGLAIAWTVTHTAAEAVAAVSDGRADVGFFAVDPVRGAGIGFTPPYLLIEGAYLVAAASPLHDNAEVDQPGHRIVVGQGSAYDLYLSRAVQQAELVRAASSAAVVDTFLAGRHTVAAGVRQQLEADAQRLGGLRLLPGRFMVIQQAMGLPKARPAVAHTALAAFLAMARQSGFLADALARHQIQGVTLA